MERKLTAILCADVFGYSRLMGDDEEATLRTLSSHRKLIDSLIEQHRGRFVNSAGDSVLAEFASVVNAVRCTTKFEASWRSPMRTSAHNRSRTSPNRYEYSGCCLRPARRRPARLKELRESIYGETYSQSPGSRSSPRRFCSSSISHCVHRLPRRPFLRRSLPLFPCQTRRRLPFCPSPT